MRTSIFLRRAGAVLLCVLALPTCAKVEADLELSAEELDFGTGKTESPLTVTNDSKDNALTSGVTTLEYQFESDRSWVAVTPVSGRLGEEESVTHMVSIDRSEMAFGANVATITATSNGGNATVTVRATRISGNCSGAPDAPSGPSPDDGDSGVSVRPSLSWEDGESQCDELTATYDVYFGTRTPPPFSHNNGSRKSWEPDQLSLNTRYYWRVVAKDANGSTTSTTWSFQTGGLLGCSDGPTNLSSLSPGDGSDNVGLDQDLSWGGGESRCEGMTATYDVYFGTSSPAPFHHNNGTSKRWDPGKLDEDRVYYWRIVAKDDNGSVSSGERDFRTRDCEDDFTAPCNPSPKNGAEDVNTRANLSWKCGSNYDEDDECSSGVTYVVYFGTSGSLDDGDILGSTSSRNYNLPQLEDDETYYWKVVVRRGLLSKSSETWEFTTR